VGARGEEPGISRWQLPRSAALAAALCAVAAAIVMGAAPAQGYVTESFTFPGEETFVVPSWMSLLHVRLVGGGGGEGNLGAEGGAGAEVTADLEVTPGNTLYLEVGGDGEATGEGGFNGGASGGGGAGGGGGASDVRLLPYSSGLTTDTRLVVAAGGGGGGGATEEPGGAGGDAGSGGIAGSGVNEGGSAGTESEGGLGGSGCGGTGGAGELGSGGAGSSGEFGVNGGGGGAGGFYGGGGGGGGCIASGGGGGGGSSLVPTGGEIEIPAASPSPEVEIWYALPPSIEIVSPKDGATYTQGQSVTAIYACYPEEGVGLVFCQGPVANGAAIDTATLGPHTFTIEAEDTEGGNSAGGVSYTVMAPSPPAGGGTPSGGPPSQPTPPETILDSHPRKLIKATKKRVKVKFSFHSPSAGATFECKLDKGAYVGCASPKRYKVKVGKHGFSVRAVKDGVADPTPATFKFKVVKAS
jgi:hypothetical protein